MIPNYIKEQEINIDSFLENQENKDNLIKILIQTLNNLGYEESSKSLQKESNLSLETPDQINLKQYILLGQWQKALNQLQYIEEKRNKNLQSEQTFNDKYMLENEQETQNQLKQNNDKNENEKENYQEQDMEQQQNYKNYNQAQFLIMREKYLEMLECNNTQDALQYLKEQIAPILKNLENSENYKKDLTYLMMIKNKEILKQKANWLGSGIESRKTLLSNIYNIYRPYDNMIPPNRIQKIMKQFKAYQIANVELPTLLNPNYSLINKIKNSNQDELLPVKQVQAVNFQSVRQAKDEVWIVQFSPNGKFLASVSKNKNIVLYKVIENNNTYKIKKISQVCDCHDKEVYCLNWKQDSQEIGTASDDCLVKIWTIKKLKLELKLKIQLKSKLFAVNWNIQENLIYTVGIEPFLYIWNKKGKLVKQVPSERNQEIHVTYDCQKIICTAQTSPTITIYSTQNYQVLDTLIETDSIMSSHLSQNSELLLVNISHKDPQLHVWNIKEKQILNTFKGFKCNQLMLKCSFGWVNDLIVSCGSEDGKIYLWHQYHQQPYKILQPLLDSNRENNTAVNCVHWNPKIPNLMVSAHDDNSVILWNNNNKNEKEIQCDLFKNKIEHIKEEDSDQEGSDIQSESGLAIDKNYFNLMSFQNIVGTFLKKRFSKKGKKSEEEEEELDIDQHQKQKQDQKELDEIQQQVYEFMEEENEFENNDIEYDSENSENWSEISSENEIQSKNLQEQNQNIDFSIDKKQEEFSSKKNENEMEMENNKDIQSKIDQ